MLRTALDLMGEEVTGLLHELNDCWNWTNIFSVIKQRKLMGVVCMK